MDRGLKLPLNSKRWSQLQCAGGSGADVPRILQRLERELHWTSGTWPPADDEPWSALLEATFDVDGIAEVAYAVLPHLVDLASARSSSDMVGVLDWALYVALGRWRPDVPSDLQAGFELGLRGLGPVANAVMAKETKVGCLQIAVAGLLLASGDVSVAKLAMHIADEDLLVECPHCGELLDVVFSSGQWELRPFVVKSESSTVLKRSTSIALPRLLEVVAAAGEVCAPMRSIADLATRPRCPLCELEFELWPALQRYHEFE
jgi:hypothetical protein